MATNSLPQSTFQPISASAVHVLARLAAKKAVQEQLRADGVRVSLLKPADISVRAADYLANHPELYRAALYRAQQMAQEDELHSALHRGSRSSTRCYFACKLGRT